MDYEEKACSFLLVGILFIIGLIIIAVNGAKKSGRNHENVVQAQMEEKTPSKTKTYEYTIISE